MLSVFALFVGRSLTLKNKKSAFISSIKTLILGGDDEN